MAVIKISTVTDQLPPILKITVGNTSTLIQTKSPTYVCR